MSLERRRFLRSAALLGGGAALGSVAGLRAAAGASEGTFADQLLAIGQSADTTIAGLQATVDQKQAALDQALADLDAWLNPSPFELTFEEDWSAGIDPARWFITNGTQFRVDHVSIDANGNLRLEVRKDSDGEWRGALVGLQSELSQTYGKFEFDGWLEAGNFRGVGMIFPNPPAIWKHGEVDLFEIGAEDPSRIKNKCSLHHDNEPPVFGFFYSADTPFTERHTLGVEWTPGKLQFFCDGAMTGEFVQPEVSDWPLKMHFQSHKSRNEAEFPTTQGAFVVERARVYAWKGVA
jgi:hypothetical protein